MGQKATKESSSASSSSSSPVATTDVVRMLEEDTLELKQWAKQSGLSSELLLYRAIEKRRAVYMSGKRCGDDLELLKEKMIELGQSIRETFFDQSADAKHSVNARLNCPDEFDTLFVFDSMADELVEIFKEKNETVPLFC
jgi:hypothetical protein